MANTIYERTYVEQIIAALEADAAGKKRLAELRAQGKSNIAIVESIMADDQGIAASNRVYEQKLIYAAELEARRDEFTPETSKWKTLTVDLRKAKADAMLFANEPYFSAGTLYHVVGNIQAKFGAALSSPALFQSLEENYGDTLKELHHFHGKPLGRRRHQVVEVRVADARCGRQSEEGRHRGRRRCRCHGGSGEVGARRAPRGRRRLASGGRDGKARGGGLSSTADLEHALAGIAADANVAFRKSGP